MTGREALVQFQWFISYVSSAVEDGGAYYLKDEVDTSDTAYNELEKCLDRLEKLEKFTELIKTKWCCLDDINPLNWNDNKVYKDTCNYDYYLFALETNHYSSKNKECVLTKEEFDLVKEVLENE